MPAPSPLKKHTAIVERLLKEEAYIVNEYNAADGRIQKAKDAAETLPGNKGAEVHQYEQEKRDNVSVYVGAKGHSGIFERITDALEKLNDELEKAGERDADAQAEVEIKAAQEVVEKAKQLIAAGEKLKKEDEDEK